MVISTTARTQDGSLATSIPAEVSRRLGINPGTELVWIEDGQGGYRLYSGGEKTRRILEAHDAAIADYGAVFRELAE